MFCRFDTNQGTSPYYWQNEQSFCISSDTVLLFCPILFLLRLVSSNPPIFVSAVVRSEHAFYYIPDLGFDLYHVTIIFVPLILTCFPIL